MFQTFDMLDKDSKRNSHMSFQFTSILYNVKKLQSSVFELNGSLGGGGGGRDYSQMRFWFPVVNVWITNAGVNELLIALFMFWLLL